MKPISKAQDTRDLQAMVEAYLDRKRCIGGRVVHPQYCCLHCGSSDPSEVCHAQKVRHPRHEVKDYLVASTRKQVRAYEVFPPVAKESNA